MNHKPVGVSHAGVTGFRSWRRRHPYLFDYIIGAAVAVVFTLLGVGFGKTSWGRALERYTHDFLQLQLASFRSPSELPIVVLDIHDWYDKEANETPRPDLETLIRALARANPRAIGIDVDFSPDDEGRFISNKDPDFFKFCESLSTAPDFGVEPLPVFLGVARRAGGPSFQWLGDVAYQDLAASIILPRNPWMVPKGITSKTAVGGPTELRAMSFALASAADSTVATRLGERSWWTEAIMSKRSSEAQEAGAVEFLLDSSTVAQLEWTTIPLAPGPLPSGVLRRVRNKVVLIGDADLGGSDAFPLAGEQRQTAGVYVHAAATVTLLGQPLKAYTERGKVVLDLGATLLTMAIVVGVRWRNRQLQNIRLDKALTWGVCVGVTLFAVFLVAWHRILWLDFVLVIGSNVVQGPAKERVDWLLEKLPDVWRYLKEPEHV